LVVAQAEAVLIAGNAHVPKFPCAGAPTLDAVLDLL
jgi:hypothetical protein